MPATFTPNYVVEKVNAVLEYTGILLPAGLAILVTLGFMYPDRLVFTHPLRKELYNPKGYPLIGNTIDVIRMGTKDQFERFHDNMIKQPAGMQLTFPGPARGYAMILNRPEYVEYVQKTNFENFEKGSNFRERFQDLLGSTGIFVADGHTWKTQRKMASHIFSVHQFKTWVQSVVHGELESVISILDGLTEGGQKTLKLPDLFFRFTLSSFGKMAFGSDIDCLRPDPQSLNEEVRFSSAFDFIQGVINKRFVNPIWKLTEKQSAEGRRNRESIKEIRTFGYNIIDERLRQREEEKKKEKPQGSKDGKDLLDLFMDLTTDREDLLTVVLNFLIAGRDTTAQGLSWLFYELMQHPEYVDEIRQEARSLLKDLETGEIKKLEYERVKDLVFTTACFNEALRLHPPVPKNGKTALKDDVIIPQGPTAAGLPSIKVYAGEQVGWSDWVMARNVDVWGPDAALFNPYRFIEEEGGRRSLRNYGQWKFHVFNGGPRLCLGMTLATYEALSFVAAVIDRFDFGWATKEQGQEAHWPLKYLNSVTHPSEMYTATVSRR